MKKVVLAVACCLSFFANGIVIRNGVDGKKYLASSEDFPPLATLYIDGTHGTLIKPSWLVTAAHATFCVAKNADIKINDKPRK